MLVEDLRHWVNDGLMALFFFVVGLEIKRELVLGELRDPRAAALPVVAALGGMVVPAAALPGRERSAATGPTGGASRWPPTSPSPSASWPCSGRGCPPSLKLFLLTLAIVDDIGAIVVIAVFYADGSPAAGSLAAAAGLVAAMVGLRRAGVRLAARPTCCSASVSGWRRYESGVHATIAGVVARPAGARPGRSRRHAVAREWAAGPDRRSGPGRARTP